MGVKGLWRLLLPIGRRISIETLEGRVLAIDASIWLTQFLAVATRQREQDLMSDDSYPSGSGIKAYSRDCLVGFLRRLCKLRYQGVKPVLVFDGDAPDIKRRELQQRRRRKRKLGGSFYLGNKRDDNFHTQEVEDEILEATRRMAKRILVKQLKSGQLVTAKKKQEQSKTPKAKEIAIGNNKLNPVSKTAVASVSYAPGFYDPDAHVSMPNPKGVRVTMTKDPTNHNDDDLLFQDYYNTNQLKEDINDWDRPIVVDCDDGNTANDSKSAIIQSQEKEYSQYCRGKASKYHAGDGTKLNVEFFTGFSESDRKNAIEDARKQRRLASRREFVKLASNPEGLSSCQLRNFLMSTKLNRDVSNMVQTAKAKADEESMIKLENAIIFEKDKKACISSRARQKSHNLTVLNDRKHYRAGTHNGKPSNEGMMRILHHRDQAKIRATTGSGCEQHDVHNFRKVRNSHYLSGGIRFEDSDEEAQVEVENTEGYPANDGADADCSRCHKTSSNVITSQGDTGGFVVAIMDSSDKNRKKPDESHVLGRNEDQIIEIDCNSESDADDWERSYKLRGMKLGNCNIKASFTRALQSIKEKKPIDSDDCPVRRTLTSSDNGGEYIEMEKSEDRCNFRGDFCQTSLPLFPLEREKAKLANVLQKVEYCDSALDKCTTNGMFVKSQEMGNKKDLFMCDESLENENEEEIDWEEGESSDDEHNHIDGDSKQGTYPHDYIKLTDFKSLELLKVSDQPSNFKRKPNLEVNMDRPQNFKQTPISKVIDIVESKISEEKMHFQPKGNTANGSEHCSVGHSSDGEDEDKKAEWKLRSEVGNKRKLVVIGKEEIASCNRSDLYEANITSGDDEGGSEEYEELTNIDINIFLVKDTDRQSTKTVSNTVQNTKNNKRSNNFDARKVELQEANLSDYQLDTSIAGGIKEMRTEIMQLLRLFGIPFVVAPAEAEAQCVELERLGLVDGIVTEDSDTFVFGGQTIYKNIFHDKNYVEVYHAKDATAEMNLTKDAFVALAMLIGGDYTEGVNGVGIVNGMEILQAFDIAQNCEAGLKRFHKWLDGSMTDDDGGTLSEKEQLFHRKHHTARTRWIAPNYFPDAKVLNAYLNPVVDTSNEQFCWDVPDLCGLVVFCHDHMGWIAEKTVKLVEPIIKQVKEASMRQTRIDSYMRYEDGIKFAKIQSNRLKQALGVLSKDTATTKISKRKKGHVATLTTSTTIRDMNSNDKFIEQEIPCTEARKFFPIMDIERVTNVITHDLVPCDPLALPQPKKKYNVKRTRSLAALSNTSASVTTIASTSKSNGASVSVFEGGPIESFVDHRIALTHVPKKAPPAYQKESTTIVEQHEFNTAKLLGDDDPNRYMVIHPSMI